jgi:tetratricopeptide (TPR) repeat protein
MGQARLKRERVRTGTPVRQKAAGGDSAGAMAALSAVARRARKHALPLAALIGLTLLAYANSFHAPFLVDNPEIILNDTRVHEVTALHLRRILTGQYWELSNVGLYRPLTTLSFLFNYSVLGDTTDPYGYHWFNFLLHAGNAVLVYLLGLAIFKRIQPALLMGGLWALHPVLTESVTNIVGRSAELAAFGVLAGLLCHRRALDARGVRKAAWLLAIGLAAAVGVFSKENGVVLLGVFAIYDFAFGREASWRSRLPSYAAALIPCLVYLYLRAHVLGNAPQLDTPYYEHPLLDAGFWTARMTAIKVIGRYFGLLLWPARLSWDYSYNEVPLFGWNPRSVEDWKAVAALFVCAAVAVVAVRCWWNRRPVFFAVAFFFVTLSPTSNLVILVGGIMGERFLYLPSIGFAMAVAWSLDALWRRASEGRTGWRYVAGAGIGALLVGFAARTYDRNGDWGDPQRFWLSAAAAAPGSFKTNMAAATSTTLPTAESVTRALGYAQRALAIVDGLPDLRNSPGAYSDAGTLYLHVGDLVASKDPSAMAAAGTDALVWYRRSLDAFLRSERIELAWDLRYRTENAALGAPGLTSMPGKLYLNLGRVYTRLADRPRALDAFERGRTLESAPDLLEELGFAYRAAGEPRKAAQALVEALAMDPNRPQVASSLVELYGEIDPHGCSVTRQGGAPGLNPDCPLVHGDICAASRNAMRNFLRRGQHEEADSIRSVAERDLGCPAGSLD